MIHRTRSAAVAVVLVFALEACSSSGAERGKAGAARERVSESVSALRLAAGEWERLTPDFVRQSWPVALTVQKSLTECPTAAVLATPIHAGERSSHEFSFVAAHDGACEARLSGVVLNATSDDRNELRRLSAEWLKAVVSGVVDGSRISRARPERDYGRIDVDIRGDGTRMLSAEASITGEDGVHALHMWIRLTD